MLVMAEPDKQYNGSHVKVHTHCAKHHARTDSDVVCSHPGTAGLLELQGCWNCRAVGTAGLLELHQYWNCGAIGTCVMTMINYARTECGCQLSQSDSNGTHTQSSMFCRHSCGHLLFSPVTPTAYPVNSLCSVSQGVQHACGGRAVGQGVGANKRDPRGFCTWGKSAPASRLSAVQWRT